MVGPSMTGSPWSSQLSELCALSLHSSISLITIQVFLPEHRFLQQLHPESLLPEVAFPIFAYYSLQFQRLQFSLCLPLSSGPRKNCFFFFCSASYLLLGWNGDFQTPGTWNGKPEVSILKFKPALWLLTTKYDEGLPKHLYFIP